MALKTERQTERERETDRQTDRQRGRKKIIESHYLILLTCVLAKDKQYSGKPNSTISITMLDKYGQISQSTKRPCARGFFDTSV